MEDSKLLMSRIIKFKKNETTYRNSYFSMKYKRHLPTNWGKNYCPKFDNFLKYLKLIQLVEKILKII